jgi:hypothetical protein
MKKISLSRDLFMQLLPVSTGSTWSCFVNGHSISESPYYWKTGVATLAFLVIRACSNEVILLSPK